MRAALLLLAAALVACSHKPELTPTQVAAQDMTEFQTQIRKTVKDSSRAEQLVAMTNEFQRLVAATAAQDSAGQAALNKLNSDFTATRSAYDSVLTGMRGERRMAAAKLIDLRVRMAAIATESEWEQLKKARVKTMDAEMNALAL